MLSTITFSTRSPWRARVSRELNRQVSVYSARAPFREKTNPMLGVHCFRGGHELCDRWPLCDCDCHPEKKLEADILAGKLSVERVHDRMMSRRYSREWRRAQRGADPLRQKSGRARGKVRKRCGQTHDGEFAQCDDCNERLRVSRAKSKEKKQFARAA